VHPDNNRVWRPIIYVLALGPALLFGVRGSDEPNANEVLFSLLVGGILLAPVVVGALRIMLRRRLARRERDAQAADSTA